MHGYGLAQMAQADEAIHAIWRFERSEVYFLLGKLVQKGHITPLATDKAGGPARTVYAPTEAGRAALLAWLAAPEQSPRNLRTSLLARAYMALRLDPRIAVELIDAQKQSLADWLASEKGRKIDNEVVALVRRLRAAQVEATLSALDDLHLLALARIGENQSHDHRDED
jgi:DNA-binding PadR family transcriptional regulator